MRPAAALGSNIALKKIRLPTELGSEAIVKLTKIGLSAKLSIISLTCYV